MTTAFAPALPDQPAISPPPRFTSDGWMAFPGTGYGWITSTDIADRAKGFWFGRFADQQKIRAVYRNIAAGRDPMDGVTTTGSWYTSAISYNSKTGKERPLVTEHDMRNDLISAALWITNVLRTAPQTTAPLYRGVLLHRRDIPAAGDRLTFDLASWAQERGWAEYYAGLPADAETGREGDTEAVYRISGFKHSVHLGSECLDEHLATGTYEVIKVSGRGRRRFITLRETAP